MKQKKHLLLAGLLLVAGMFSCNTRDDVKPEPQKGKAIEFEFGFNSTKTQTDINFNTTFVNNDKIGVYAVKAGEPLLETGNYIHNRPLAYNATTQKWSWFDETATGPGYRDGGFDASEIYMPSDWENMDFYTYYPYDATNDNPTKILIKVGSQSLEADFNNQDQLFGSKLNASNPKVDIAFVHLNALVQIKVTPPAGKAFDDTFKVILNNVPEKNYLNAKTGALTPQESPISTIDLEMYKFSQEADGSSATFHAIVPAHTATLKTDFIQTTLAKEINHTYTTGVVNFTSGKVKKYEIAITPTIIKKVYAIGDPYPDATNTVGIVYEIGSDGTSGKIIHLKKQVAGASGQKKNPWHADYNYKWDTRNNALWGYQRPAYGSIDNNNGLANTEKVINAAKSVSGTEINNLPPFKYVNDLNTAQTDVKWYIPAKDELMAMIKMLYDNNTVKNSYQSKSGYNISSKSSDEGFWSSTEWSNQQHDEAWRVLTVKRGADSETSGNYSMTPRDKAAQNLGSTTYRILAVAQFE